MSTPTRDALLAEALKTADWLEAAAGRIRGAIGENVFSEEYEMAVLVIRALRKALDASPELEQLRKAIAAWDETPADEREDLDGYASKGGREDVLRLLHRILDAARRVAP